MSNKCRYILVVHTDCVRYSEDDESIYRNYRRGGGVKSESDVIVVGFA